MRKENIRAIKTKSSIKKQFLNLLKNKSLDLISVIDIARECKVNRNTFYLHYKSINDLFFSLKQEIFSLFLSPLQTFTIDELTYNIDIILSLYSNIFSTRQNVKTFLFEIKESDTILNELENEISNIVFKRYKKTIYTQEYRYKVNIMFIVFGYFHSIKQYVLSNNSNFEIFSERISLLLNKGLYKTYNHTLHR